MNESKTLLKVAVERGYLGIRVARQVLRMARQQGCSAERILRDEELLSERRIDRRVALDLPVAAFRGGIPKRYRLVDLSCGGAQIESGDAQAPPPVHTLELDFGEGRVMRMLARTVWVKGARYAVSFLALDGFDRLTIAEGIDWLLALRKAAPLSSPFVMAS